MDIGGILMLDMKRLRNDIEEVNSRLALRGDNDYGLSKVLELDKERRDILQDVEQKKNRQKIVSKEIPMLKKDGKDTTDVMAEMKELSNTIKDMDTKVKDLDDSIREMLLGIPNTPHMSTPKGETDEDNILYKTWNEPSTFDFEPKAHWDLGVDLDILDFERATKITGTRFTVLKGSAARMELYAGPTHNRTWLYRNITTFYGKP